MITLRNSHIKKRIKQIRKYQAIDYVNIQPHVNDRWRAIRRSLKLPANYIITGTGKLSFWINIYKEPNDRTSEVSLTDYTLTKRQNYLERKDLI